MKIAFVFPGQGSQVVGMGHELYEKSPAARAAFEKADAAFDGGLMKLCFEGPEELLRQTPNTQPALVATSVACLRALEEHGVRPDIVAGHSVGEYSALVAAGALQPDDAIRLTHLRGKLMESACPSGTGGMAALRVPDRAAAESLCDAVKESGVAEVAALNTPGQVVLAGHLKALNDVVTLSKERGVGVGTMLAVSGPFHSSLMKPAEDGLRKALAEIPFVAPRIPVVTNVEARPEQDPAALKNALIGQVTRAVLWQASVEEMIAGGVTVFVELGAGRVLSGLIKKINKTVTCHSVADAESLGRTLEFFRANG